MQKISDTIERKFIEVLDVSDWEIESDSGWVDIVSSNKTIEYDVYEVKTESGKSLKCADTHIVFDENFEEVFVIDLIPNKSKIQTKN